MTRRNLFAAVAIVASVVLTACSDMTAPQNDTPCPIVNGSSTCATK
jgi:outer membrane biogenesis lipoprotein LolB